MFGFPQLMDFMPVEWLSGAEGEKFYKILPKESVSYVKWYPLGFGIALAAFGLIIKSGGN